VLTGRPVAEDNQVKSAVEVVKASPACIRGQGDGALVEAVDPAGPEEVIEALIPPALGSFTRGPIDDQVVRGGKDVAVVSEFLADRLEVLERYRALIDVDGLDVS
jgi:hypothetical protein